MSDFVTTLVKAASGFMYSFTGRELGTGDELFRFEASRLQQRAGQCLADVTVFSRISTARTVPGGTGYVTRQTVDLLSARSKSNLASDLNRLIPAPKGASAINWEVTVEEFAQKVMDGENDRPEVLDLSSVAPNYDTPYLIPYLLPEDKPSILYAAGGTGKSVFAAAMAAAIQEGVDFLGWPVQQRNVLYLDWESDAGDISRRNALVSTGLGLTTPAAVRYTKPNGYLNDHDTLMHIAETVARYDIGFVVVDSTVMAMKTGQQQADPAEAAKEFYGAIKRLGVTALAIDHMSGEDMRRRPGSPSKPYGSVFKWNIARNVFEMVAPEDEPDTLILKHRKCNVGPKMATKTLTMKWGNVTDGVTFTESAKAYKYEMTPGTRILTALAPMGSANMERLLEALASQPGYDPLNSVDVGISVAQLEEQELVYVDTARQVIHITAKARAAHSAPVQT